MKNKRLLSAILAAALTLTSLPIAISAGGAEPSNEPWSVVIADTAINKTAFKPIAEVAPAFANVTNKYLYLGNRTTSGDGIKLTSTVANGANAGKKLELWFDVAVDKYLMKDNATDIPDYGTKGNIRVVSRADYADSSTASDCSLNSMGYNLTRANGWISVEKAKIEYDYNSLNVACKDAKGNTAQALIRASGTADIHPTMIDNLRVVDVTNAKKPIVVATETFDDVVVNGNILIDFGNVTANGYTYELGTLKIEKIGSNTLSIGQGEAYYSADFAGAYKDIVAAGNVPALDAGSYIFTAMVKNDSLIIAGFADGKNAASTYSGVGAGKGGGVRTLVNGYIEADGGDDYYRYYAGPSEFELMKDNNTVDVTAKVTLSDNSTVTSTKFTKIGDWTKVEVEFDVTSTASLKSIALLAEPTIGATSVLFPKANTTIGVKDAKIIAAPGDNTVTMVGGKYYDSLADAVANLNGLTNIELYKSTTESVEINAPLTIKKNGFTADNITAGEGFFLFRTTDSYVIKAVTEAEGNEIPAEYFTVGDINVSSISEYDNDFVDGNRYLYVYNRVDNVDGIQITSDVANDNSALVLSFKAFTRTNLLNDAKGAYNVSLRGSSVSRSNPAVLSFPYTTAQMNETDAFLKHKGILVSASNADWCVTESFQAYGIDDLAIYDGSKLVWSYDFSDAFIINDKITINTATQGTTHVAGYDLGTITISAHNVASGSAVDGRKVAMKVVADESYAVAKVTDNADGSAGEITYDMGGVALKKGVYTLSAFFKNDEHVTSAFGAAGTNFNTTGATDVYFTYWSSGHNHYLKIDNNVINVGAKLNVTNAEGESEAIENAEIYAVNAEDFTKVTFEFEVKTDSFTLDEIAFTAQHLLSGKTLANANGSNIASIDYATVNFKGVEWAFDAPQEENSAFGVFALLLIKKKMAAAGQTPVTPKPVETTEAAPETTEAPETTVVPETTVAPETTEAPADETTAAPETEAPVAEGNIASVAGTAVPATIATAAIGKEATAKNVGIYNTGVLNKNKVEAAEGGVKVSGNAAGSNSILINTGIVLPAGTYTITADLKAEAAQNMAIFVQNPAAPSSSYINKPGEGKKPIDLNASMNELDHVVTKTVNVGTEWTTYTNTIKLAEDTLLVLKVGGASISDVSNFFVKNISVK